MKQNRETVVAHGTLSIENGMLELFDSRAKCRLTLLHEDSSVIEQLVEWAGETVKVIAEPHYLLAQGYVLCRQVERMPEEYSPVSYRIDVNIERLSIGNYCYPHLANSHPALPHWRRHGELDWDPANAFDDIRPILIDKPTHFNEFMRALSEIGGGNDQWDLNAVASLGLSAMENYFRVDFVEEIFSEKRWLSNKKQHADLSGSNALPPVFEQKNGLVLTEKEEGISQPKPKRVKISSRLRYEILLRDSHRCVDCGASAADDPLVRLEIDHRIPVSMGGTNDLENLQTLCWACNNGKRDNVDHKLEVPSLSDDLWAAVSS